MPVVSEIQVEESGTLLVRGKEVPVSKSPVHKLSHQVSHRLSEETGEYSQPLSIDKLAANIKNSFDHGETRETIYTYNENIKLKFNAFVFHLELFLSKSKSKNFETSEDERLKYFQQVMIYSWFLNYYFTYLHHSPTQKESINKRTMDCFSKLNEINPALVAPFRESLPSASNNADFFRIKSDAAKQQQQISWYEWFKACLGLRYLRTSFIPKTNWLRLLIVRLGRVLGCSAALWPSELSAVANAVVGVTGGLFFGVLSWAYYTPRLFLNLALLCKHTFSPWCASRLRELT